MSDDIGRQIAELMSGAEWSGDTCQGIAEILRGAGYRVLDLADQDEDDDGPAHIAAPRPPSEDEDTITVELTHAEIDQLIAGLEARQYWELSDEHHRQNGEPIPPADDDEDDAAQDYRTLQRLILLLHQSSDPHCSCSLCQQQLIDEGQR